MAETPGAQIRSQPPPGGGGRRAPGDSDLHLTFESNDHATREALETVVANLSGQMKCGELVGTVELVLAEILNNIAEHAYAGHGAGPVALDLCCAGNLLRIDIADQGAPMPGGSLPDPDCASVAAETADLPEGGFGWFLIHELTESMHYRRDDGCNRLSVTFSCG